MPRIRSTLIALAALVCVAGASAQVTNDSCSSATPIFDGVTPGTNVGSTTGPDPVGNCGAMGQDVWYAYTSSCTGTVTASFCGAGNATYDTVLAAWSGTCSCLAELTCNDDFCGLQSEITFFANAGVVYYISVGGFGGNTGTFNLNLFCTPGPPPPPPPANDTCSTAIFVTEGVVTPGTNVGATVGSACGGSDPSVTNCGFNNGADVWYTIVPVCSGTYTATTCVNGTSYDTVLGIWDGTLGCAGLTPLACNDDNCSLGTQFLSSTVTWSATAGSVYYISVSGYFGATGTFNLLVSSGAGLTLTFQTPGPGALGYQVLGGPPSGTQFTAIALVAGAYPFGWFHGIDIAFADLIGQITLGFPFATPLSSCGDSTVGPFFGLPSGLTVYGVSLGIPVGLPYPTTASAPATATIP
jgi:hypothetical protein